MYPHGHQILSVKSIKILSFQIKMDIDPYKMMGVPKNFTPDQLKAAYKKLALQMHPDKQGGNDYMFKLLTSCYKTLVKDYNKRVQDRQFHELKQESQKYTPQYAPIEDPKKAFNIDKFNNIFEQNKLPDQVRDTGYNDWLRSGDSEASNQPKIKGKFSLSSFNSQFEKATSAQPSKHVIKYQEPEPLQASKKIQFTELGVDKVDDFSGDNMTKKNLNYMDLKLAHTTERIVDPRTVEQRKAYKNVGDIEADRANVQYNMSDKEKQEYLRKKKLEELREKQRVESLNAYDQRTSQHFERVNRLMLGGRL
jgi:curved DNA-binding protein CbpA